MKENDKKKINLTRKRYYPKEVVDLKTDELLFKSDNLIVTKWYPINERDDIGFGISFWFLDKGYKISKIYNKDKTLRYYYCDICRYEIEETDEEKNITMVDLLLDIVVYQDQTYKVLDFDELIDLYDKKEVQPKDFMISIKNFSRLMTIINEVGLPYELLDKYNI